MTFKISKGANTIRPEAQSSLTLHKKICLFLGLNECLIIGWILHTHHSLVPKSRFLNTFANHYWAYYPQLNVQSYCPSSLSFLFNCVLNGFGKVQWTWEIRFDSYFFLKLRVSVSQNYISQALWSFIFWLDYWILVKSHNCKKKIWHIHQNQSCD